MTRAQELFYKYAYDEDSSSGGSFLGSAVGTLGGAGIGAGVGYNLGKYFIRDYMGNSVFTDATRGAATANRMVGQSMPQMLGRVNAVQNTANRAATGGTFKGPNILGRARFAGFAPIVGLGLLGAFLGNKATS